MDPLRRTRAHAGVAPVGPGLHWRPESERTKPLAIEWVYFKFFSAHADGIVVFGSGWGLPGVISVQVFPRDAAGHAGAPVCVSRHDYPLAQVTRSTTDYECLVAESAVTRGPDGYATAGAIAGAGHAIAWDLAFAAEYAPIASFAGRFGALRLGHLAWDLIEPLATVTGSLVVDGATVAIDGWGYVDTNRGRWLFGIDPTTHWNWVLVHGEAAGSRLLIAGMNVRATPALGRLYLRDGDTSLSFPCDAGTFVHRAFTRDPATGTRFPVLTTVAAHDEAGHRLELTLTNDGAHVYRQAIPPAEMRAGLPTVFAWDLCESFVTATGTLRAPGGATRPLAARGIKEYPVTRIALQR
ncbi:MAG TPA: hypothetical protein VGQ83_35965 [Polyangia bacterium]